MVFLKQIILVNANHKNSNLATPWGEPILWAVGYWMLSKVSFHSWTISTNWNTSVFVVGILYLHQILRTRNETNIFLLYLLKTLLSELFRFSFINQIKYLLWRRIFCLFVWNVIAWHTLQLILMFKGPSKPYSIRGLK